MTKSYCEEFASHLPALICDHCNQACIFCNVPREQVQKVFFCNQHSLQKLRCCRCGNYAEEQAKCCAICATEQRYKKGCVWNLDVQLK